MEGDFARHEVHDGGASLFTVDTRSSLLSGVGIHFDGEDDGRNVEVLLSLA